MSLLERSRGRSDPGVSTPTREDLVRDALRNVAGAALVVLAAAIVHSTGHADQQWQYVVMAAALAPQVLIDALAVHDRERRRALRTSRRYRPLPLLVAAALTVAAMVTLPSGPAAPALAALAAAAGLTVAAAPVTVTVARRQRS